MSVSRYILVDLTSSSHLPSFQRLQQWAPQPPSTEKKMGTARQVAVQKNKKEPEMGKPKSRMVSVAKTSAARRASQGPGAVGFRRAQNLPTPRARSTAERGHAPTVKYEKKRQQQQRARLSRDDNNPLANWQHRMMERKRQQGYISKLLQKAPEDLAMNQADNFRKVQEQRYLVDRAIPGVDYGKGYRVGSEFWHQQEQFGDDLTGLQVRKSGDSSIDGQSKTTSQPVKAIP
ncbi:hypothetical protein RRG08_065884 [Elysia crispata]|uniref:Uncharacterized protein n=1 Tax=Elysia crispata TaxID=231223 RepID=A0AAE1B019_9GAST|nr:hypothetical protein RRG08_065884 [Elysia crispata]